MNYRTKDGIERATEDKSVDQFISEKIIKWDWIPNVVKLKEYLEVAKTEEMLEKGDLKAYRSFIRHVLEVVLECVEG